ncbi:heme exporter protein CcmB [Candidatus Bipolaricaulota bacterium]|nr:heme exporter protein CcmB [Candidatus Bipolaricaulota bacterium]
MTIVWKDMIAEWRTKEMFSSMFVFILLVIVIFKFSFDLRVSNATLLVPGILWAALTFAGTLQLGRSASLEIEDAHVDGLLLAPVPRSSIYLGKALGNLMFMSITELIMLPIFSALFNLNLFRPLILLAIFLGTIGFASVGTLLSTMAAHSRAREVMLPVLLFPIVLPVVIAAVKLTAGVLDGGTWQELAVWVRFLIAFDIVFLVISLMTFRFVVEG